MVQDEQEKWDIVIKPRSGLFRLDLEEVWLYRDLLVMYIRRDIVTFYKQTVLGPLWFVIQPLLTTVMFMFVFGYSLMVNGYAWLAPLLLLMLAGLGLGFGLLISSLTTKYRDLRFLITFGVQLWMYATPVIYPLSVMRQSHEQYMWIIVANPLTSLIETFKFGFLGVGTFSWFHLGYTLAFTVVIMLWGMVTFNRVQRSFMDVI